MPLVVRAFPLLPGKEEELQQFAAELSGARGAETATFYDSFSVSRETWHLQQTDHGALVIGVTEVAEPVQEIAQEYAASQRAFDRWFKDKVRELTGIDPDTQPLGPPAEQIFEFRARGRD
ncbi:MAG: hypothetical protein ACRD2T_16240 [Thermoanaerobaculia bacterium]